MNTLSLGGIFPPLCTPFDRAGDLALDRLVENIRFLNQHDLAGYIVLGSNGEAGYLSWEEKRRVWEAARGAIPTGKLMVAGTGSESTRQTVALTEMAAQAGADAALVVTPHYYGGKMTPDSLSAHYLRLADSVPIPVILYTVPKFTHVDFDAATIARLADHPNIIGIKDTSGNIARMADVVRLAPNGFQVLAGSAGFFLPGLVAGAVGGILALSNIAPQKCLEVHRLFKMERWAEAADLQRALVPVNAAVTARFGIAGLKAALDMLGLYGGPVRLPLLELREGERQILRGILLDGDLL
jgi:4-hydroxy-2-oxoglutarate aldolase